jgi:hypothetical protein
MRNERCFHVEAAPTDGVRATEFSNRIDLLRSRIEDCRTFTQAARIRGNERDGAKRCEMLIEAIDFLELAKAEVEGIEFAMAQEETT